MYKPSCKRFSYMETTLRTGIYRRCSVYQIWELSGYATEFIRDTTQADMRKRKLKYKQIKSDRCRSQSISSCEKQPLLTASPGREAATIQCITIHSALGVAIGIKQQSARKIGSNKHQVMRNAAELCHCY